MQSAALYYVTIRMFVKKTDFGYIKVIILIFGLLLFWAYTFKNLKTGTQIPISTITEDQTNPAIGSVCQKGDGSVIIDAPSFHFSDKDGKIAPSWSSNRQYKKVLSNILVKALEFYEGHHVYDTNNERDLLSAGEKYKDPGTGVEYKIYALAGDRKNPDKSGGTSNSNYCNSKVSEKPECQIFYAEYDILLLVKLGSDGKPVTAGGPFTGKKNTDWDVLVAADIYQAVDSPKTLADWMLDCRFDEHGKQIGINNTGTGTNTQDSSSIQFIPEDPSKKSPDQKELQLETFYLKRKITRITTPSQGTLFALGCKPAIYLYPQTPIRVNVKVNTKGSFTFTDPVYPPGGWNTLATANGDIFVDEQKYPYLYYESKIPDELVKIPSQGLVVEFFKLDSLYDTLLPNLGLNEVQTKDFKDYWLKTLPYSPYYFVGIMNQEDINAIEPLEITPKPDLVSRVRLYFQALDKKMDPSLPNIQPSTYNSQPGFRVVEWGGMFKSDPLHPFTCSQ